MNFPNEVIDVYLRYASILLYEFNLEAAGNFLSRACVLIKQKRDSFYWGSYNNIAGIISFIRGEDVQGFKYLNHCIGVNISNNSLKDMTYTYENLIRGALTCNSSDLVGRYVQLNLANERKYRPEAKFNRTVLFEAYHQASLDFAGKFDYFVNIIENYKQVKPVLCDYLLNTLCYLHGRSPLERENGLSGLLKIKNSSYKLAAEGVKRVIAEKKFFPII
jgi:hypothetical protein